LPITRATRSVANTGAAPTRVKSNNVHKSGRVNRAKIISQSFEGGLEKWVVT
jgi:hypothetical protein